MKQIPLLEEHRALNVRGTEMKEPPLYDAERLSLAFQILGGIPEKRVNLDTFGGTFGDPVDSTCLTIACGGGWLARHPEMQRLGLSICMNGWKGLPTYHGMMGIRALGKFFAYRGLTQIPEEERISNYGIHQYIAKFLFAQRRNGRWDGYLVSLPRPIKEGDAGDKQLLMRRLKYAYDHFSG